MATLAEPRASVIVGDRRQVTSKYTDNSEVYEEFDVVTDDLLLRQRRTKNHLGAFTPWVVEVGSSSTAASHRLSEQALISEASGSPQLVRQDTQEAYVYRIRNLPYDRSVFSVTVESTKNTMGEIVVRTSNKKYFKRLEIPDMARAGIALDASRLSFEVKYNTLVITYKKHLSILAAEAAEKKERLSMPVKRQAEEPQSCKTQ